MSFGGGDTQFPWIYPDTLDLNLSPGVTDREETGPDSGPNAWPSQCNGPRSRRSPVCDSPKGACAGRIASGS